MQGHPVLASPIILLLIVKAWAERRTGIPPTRSRRRTISSKDQVIAGGRWVYDGSHDGYNEMHATRIVQKVAYVPKDAASFAAFQRRWCDEQNKVPHTDPAGNAPPGSTPRAPRRGRG